MQTERDASQAMGADDAHKELELINEGSAHRAWHSGRCGDGLPIARELRGSVRQAHLFAG